MADFAENMTVVIIGAGGGIGSALLDKFSQWDRVGKIYAATHVSPLAPHDKVEALKLDITDEDSIIDACSKIQTPVDIVIVATGILHSDDLQPEKNLNDLSMEKFQRIFAVNCFGPALVAKHLAAKMNRAGKSVFSAISARVGSISDNHLGGWYAYRASKAALNMILKNISIEVARKNKNAVVLGLHPGTVDTRLSKPFQSHVKEGKLFTAEYSAGMLFDIIQNCSPEDSGKLFDYNKNVIEF